MQSFNPLHIRCSVVPLLLLSPHDEDGDDCGGWVVTRRKSTLMAVRLIRTKEQDQDETHKVEREPKHWLRILPGMSTTA